METTWTDGAITIRPVQIEDAPLFFEAARESLETVGRWFDWCHAELTLEECRQWFRDDIQGWADRKSYFFSVVDARSGRYLGSGWLNSFHFKHPFANMGYWVRRSEEGKGIATRTARFLADFGLNQVGLCRVEIVVDVENLASQRVAEKIGALREGILRSRLAFRGRPRDAVMYSRIRPR